MDGQKEEETEEKEAVKECFDSVIFDLDGTLWNTVPVCTQAWNEVMAKLSINRKALTDDDMASIMGMTPEEIKLALFPGIEKEVVDKVVQHSFARETELLRKEGGQLYDGVAKGLSLLVHSHRLFLVSNCELPYLDAFFEWSGFGSLFEDSECIGRTGRPKGENISAVVKRNALNEPVYVGDTRSDERAAYLAGVPFIFANYGFGQAQDPVQIVNSFNELVEYLSCP